MRRVIPPLLNTSLWRGAGLRKRNPVFKTTKYAAAIQMKNLFNIRTFHVINLSLSCTHNFVINFLLKDLKSTLLRCLFPTLDKLRTPKT
jgi:hypothetical protein